MTYPIVTVPNYLTPHGKYNLLKGRIPDAGIISWDGTVEHYILGGRTFVDHVNPESVRIKSLKGITSQATSIDQKGATEDGVTFVTALYDPLEIDITLEARGRTPQRCRKVVSDFYATIDAIRTSVLYFQTHEEGRWWTDVRWFKAPTDELGKIQTPKQQLSIVLRGDSGLWRSDDNTDAFAFAYEDMTDTFDVDYSGTQNLGPNWPQKYSDAGIGFCYADGNQAVWNDDPDSIFFTGTRQVVCGPYKSFSTTGDNQEIDLVVNNTPEFTVGAGAANDIWGRMGRNMDGSWNGYGVRARIGWGYVQISYFANFVETILKQDLFIIPPLIGDKFTLRCGLLSNSRFFVLLRNDTIISTVIDISGLSAVGASYRGVGFGLQGGAAALTQATPAEVRKVQSESMLDTFNYTTDEGLGANWPLWYEGRTDAFVHANGNRAEWVDNSGTDTQEVVNGPYKAFQTSTNNQVINMVMATFQEFSIPDSGANDLWGRMGHDEDGNWDGNGIRLRLQGNFATISRFNDFVPTEMWSRFLFIPPAPGEKFTLVCGIDGSERTFKVLRNGLEVLTTVETSAESALGASYRGVGFGMLAGGALVTQATPASIRKISAGDNATVTQSGFIHRNNIGDQPMFDDYTVFGPGTFRIWNGPVAGANDYVEFGPLLPNQVMLLRSDPGKRSVHDLTVTPPTPQELNAFQQALDNFLSFAFANNIPPLVKSIVSQFGVLAPQGNPYSLLKGRWSDDAAIPPKSPGKPAEPYSVKVEVVGGTADSKLIASGTPRRRYPL